MGETKPVGRLLHWRVYWEPRDWWIGLYVGPVVTEGWLVYRRLYFCPLPTLVVAVDWGHSVLGRRVGAEEG